MLKVLGILNHNASSHCPYSSRIAAASSMISENDFFILFYPIIIINDIHLHEESENIKTFFETMAQCIEVVNALSSQRLQEMKTLFWNMTTLTDTIQSWFTQLSPAFLYSDYA